jgi:hypothetical protein
VKNMTPVLLFVAFWSLLAFGGRTQFFSDPGTYWHTAVGEKILDEGFFDKDPYTFTFKDQKWIPHQWLGEVIMAQLYRTSKDDDGGSFAMLLLASTGLLAGIFTHLTMRFLRIGLQPLLALLIVGLVLAVSSTHFHIRPHLATMLGMVLTMVVLVNVESGKWSWRSVAILIPVYLAWANCHGGVLGGLLTMGLAGIAWTVLLMLQRTSPLTGYRSVLGLLAIGLLCAATYLVNPYGLELPKAWWGIMNMPSLSGMIVEHAPPDWSKPGNWPLVILTVVYLALLAGVPVREWRVTWFLPLFWAVQAYGRVRHAPLFAMLSAIAIADFWPYTRYAHWLAKKRPDLYTPVVLYPKSWVALSIISLFIVAMSLLTVKFVKGIDGIDCISPMTDHKFRPPAGRVFNDYSLGGPLILLRPDCPVFVDDRCELFGDDWLRDFIETSYAEPDVVARRMAEWQAQYGDFDYALVLPGTAFDRYFANRPDQWYNRDRSKTSVLYIKKKPIEKP